VGVATGRPQFLKYPGSPPGNQAVPGPAVWACYVYTAHSLTAHPSLPTARSAQLSASVSAQLSASVSAQLSASPTQPPSCLFVRFLQPPPSNHHHPSPPPSNHHHPTTSPPPLHPPHPPLALLSHPPLPPPLSHQPPPSQPGLLSSKLSASPLACARLCGSCATPMQVAARAPKRALSTSTCAPQMDSTASLGARISGEPFAGRGLDIRGALFRPSRNVQAVGRLVFRRPEILSGRAQRTRAARRGARTNAGRGPAGRGPAGCEPAGRGLMTKGGPVPTMRPHVPRVPSPCPPAPAMRSMCPCGPILPAAETPDTRACE
jgi:hypothetical protein